MMNFDSNYLGAEGFGDGDKPQATSRYAEIRDALFKNAYYSTWGSPGEPRLPVYGVTLRRTLRNILPGGELWKLQAAAGRTLDSRTVLRWGEDNRGFRRLLHPNGIALFGRWITDADTDYTGYFAPRKEALVIARYSVCCTETRRGYYRSLSLVGLLYPTDNPLHETLLPTASFITQEDLGGARTFFINDAILRNAPDTTPWRRGMAFPVLALTGLAFLRVDREPAFRQVYEIAELAKPEGQTTRSPNFMQLTVDANQPRIYGEELDFRDEILAQIYDRGNPEPMRKLVFNIEVTDSGKTRGKLVQRRTFDNWRTIGRLEFSEAVASYNTDFVLHIHHPPWRIDRNKPESVFRRQPG